MPDLLQIFIYQPFLNLLTFYTWITPGHWLAVGIILLTLTVRFILLIPYRKQMVSQRQMNALSPALKELPKRFGVDREGLAKAQLAMYKAYDVNPFSSCLIIPVQLVLLTAVYFTISHGIDVNNPNLYSWIPRPETINSQLFIFDLLKVDPTFILGLLASVLQYVQIKMSFPKVAPGEVEEQSMAVMRKVLIATSVLPLLFSTTIPAGAILYWIVTTIFSIVQQRFANRNTPDKIPVAEVFARLEAEGVVVPDGEVVEKTVGVSQPKKITDEKKGKGGVKVVVRKKQS